MDAETVPTGASSPIQQYRALLEIADAISAHHDLPSLLQDLAERLKLVVDFDAANVVLYDKASNSMRLHGFVSASHPEIGMIAELSVEDAPAGWVWQNQKPLLMTDLSAYESRYPYIVAELNRLGIKTAYALPLTSAGHRLGALGFGSMRVEAWNEGDQEFLQQVAKLVAVAVENALNFERAQQSEQIAARERDRLRLLLEINNAVVSHLDLKELVKAISATLHDILPHDAAGIALYEPELNLLREYTNVAYKDLDAFQEGETIPLEGTPAGQVFLTGQPLLIRQPNETRYPADRYSQRPVEASPKSACLAPLISHGRSLGIVGVSSTLPEQFTEEDLELFCQIASQVAIAVENALNFERIRIAEEEAKRQSERLQLMLKINNAAVSELSLHELVRVTSTRLREALHHDVTGISLYDPEINQFRAYMFDLPDNMPPIEEGTLMPLEGSVGGIAFVTGKPVFMSRPDPDRLSSEFDKRLTDAGIRSGGVVPLIAHEKKLGFLGVGSFREDAFSVADQELLCHIANQIAIAVENALAYREIETLKNKLASEKLYLEDEIRTQHNFEELIGESQTFRKILKQVETVAPTDSTVLICGETGTGKELIARAIHDLSQRRERTLVKINCAAIPTGLLESELFGHEKGAFTGAISQRVGRFELANRGTLFLDEVGDIPLELQPKLLRVLQEQEFERLGSTRTQKVDVRMIAATNCDLEQLVADRKYRSDLYYRLNVFPITIPPLRQRREDIPALTRFFTQKYARQLKKTITAIPAETMTALTNYHWPGNVRELEHFIERAVILTRGGNLEVSLAELKSSEPIAITELTTLHDAEREHILRALEESNWVVGGPQGAATRLGMKRTTLQSKMQKLGISRQS